MLLSEVQRLRGRLSLQANDGDLFAFIFRDSDVSMDYVEDLRERLKYGVSFLPLSSFNWTYAEIRKNS